MTVQMRDIDGRKLNAIKRSARGRAVVWCCGSWGMWEQFDSEAEARAAQAAKDNGRVIGFYKVEQVTLAELADQELQLRREARAEQAFERRVS